MNGPVTGRRDCPVVTTHVTIAWPFANGVAGPFANRVTGPFSNGPYTASTANATPLPPPRHNAAIPRFTPRRFIAYSSVVSTREPLAPIG